VASLYTGLGNVYQSLGKYEEALECYQKELDITVRLVGQPGRRHEHLQYSRAERDSRRFGRGAQVFLECENIYAKALGADHEKTLDAAMRAQTVGEEEEDEEGGGGDSNEGEEEDQAGDSEESE
jgi:tetratricopeptide (TPR) repeat protein